MELLRKAMTLALGEGAARLIGVVVYAIVARSLGVDGLGVFAFAMSAALVVGVFLDMGQANHLGRLVGRHGEEKGHLFVRLVVNSTVLGLFAIVLVCLAMLLLGMDATSVMCVALMIVWVAGVCVVGGLRSLLRGLGYMGADSTVNALESVARLVGVVIAALLGAPVVVFCAVFAVESIVSAMIASVFVGRKTRLVPTALEWRESTTFLRSSTSLGFASLASAGFYRIDQVLILPLAGAAASGLYGAASRVAFTAAVAAQLVAQAVYPRFCAAQEDSAAFRKNYRQALGLAVTVASLIAVLVFVFAEHAITIVFGMEYVEATLLLRVLCGVVLLNAVTTIASHSVGALHRERTALKPLVVLLVLNVVANLILLPRVGVIAAAWVSVIGEFLLALSLIWITRDRLGLAGLFKREQQVDNR